MEFESNEKYLQHIARLTEENNQLLRRIDRRDRAVQTGTMVRRVIGLVLIVMAYFYVQPYLKNVQSMYETAMGQLTQLSETTQNLNPFSAKAKQ
jgi:hypothetical protein